jgi:hypothetical protein
MSKDIKQLINQVGTDVSGKWIAVDKIDQLAELIIRECMSNLYLNGYDDALDQVKEHFGIK